MQDRSRALTESYTGWHASCEAHLWGYIILFFHLPVTYIVFVASVYLFSVTVIYLLKLDLECTFSLIKIDIVSPFHSLHPQVE